MPDVRLYMTPDGGGIDVANGVIVMSDDMLETAAILSMFGGNEQDGGQEGTRHLQWWGNLDEPLPERRYRSESQFLLRSIPLISGNLLRLQDAAAGDLAWMVAELGAKISVAVRMPRVNAVAYDITIDVDGRKVAFSLESPR